MFSSDLRNRFSGTMDRLRTQFWKCMENSFYTLLGLLVTLTFIIYTVIVSPLFLYRWFLVNYLKPVFRPDLRKAVTVVSQFLAAEFIPEKTSFGLQYPLPRSAISFHLYISGNVPYELCIEHLTKGWFTKKNDEAELRYPEFQQYLVEWMGYMFWKQDPNFCLSNHIYQHTIPNGASLEECESILKSLVESAINKRFPLQKSPWEVHLIHNYKNPSIRSLDEDNGTMTIVLFRFHHGMVDGFSVMYAFIEGLLGQKLPSIDYAKPKDISSSSEASAHWKKMVHNGFYIPWRMVRDMGYLITVRRKYRSSSSSPWHCEDDRKKWFQICDKTQLIPMERIKFIKNKFGVSFTTVLFAALTAGAAEHFQKKKSKNTKLPTFIVVPLPGHPNKLRNHALGSALELNLSKNFSSVERLNQLEAEFLEARHHSQIPTLSWIITKVLSGQPTTMAKYLVRNRCLHALMTNFPGPGLQLKAAGRSVLSLEFCIGALSGVCGVAFSIVSYNNNVRISVTAEHGVMEREELAELISTMEKEFEMLYNKATAMTTLKGISMK